MYIYYKILIFIWFVNLSTSTSNLNNYTNRKCAQSIDCLEKSNQLDKMLLCVLQYHLKHKT